MPFNLFITSAEGDRTFKSLRSPYDSRPAMRPTLRMIARNDRESRDETEEFVEQVIAAPLGETVHQAATGVAFRTEEI